MPSSSTLATLVKRGYLTEKPRDDEVTFFTSIVSRLHETRRRAAPHFVIMPTYDCNLRCHYCFQDHMRTDPRFHGLLRTMSRDMADRIMAAFPFIEPEYHTYNTTGPLQRQFTFFGGEPLLASSRPIVEYIMRSQQRQCSASFSAITNGTELEAYEDLLGPENLSKLQITIDGPEATHDQRRVYPDRTGSFSGISQNVYLALHKGANLQIRVNVDRNSFDSLIELADMFIDKGWADDPNFHAYLAPIQDYSGLKNAGTRPDFFNYWELSEMLRKLHEREPKTRVFARVDGSLRDRVRAVFKSQGPIEARTAFCGAHVSMYLFDAFGDIYACWDRTGDRNLRIGTVNEDGTVTINGFGESWRSRSVVSNATCRQCRYALHCGGGCAVLAELSSGTMFSNFCSAFGKRFRTAIAEAYGDHQSKISQPRRSDGLILHSAYLR
ncbi:MAG: radical SAM protein [Vulcanimicrobiaceae bacterium]